jgi:folate-binding protein YgfZ
MDMRTHLDLAAQHAASGAKVADDGIPLYYTDLLIEYQAALNAAVLLDRSHEGRIRLRGGDRAALLHRISTNDLLTLAPGEGRPTLFTSSTARILDRAVVYNIPQDSLMLLTGPGRGEALAGYLQRNIFFRDDVQIEDLRPQTRQFALHGRHADAVMTALVPEAAALAPLHSSAAVIAGTEVWIARRKPYVTEGTHWTLIAPAAEAVAVWDAILAAGQPHGLIAAGSLTFNTLRIRAGRPGVGRELTEEYIPLELGLWDEVSFSKGCYTGQEVIARMESRAKLAKTIVTLHLSQMVNAPAPLLHEDKRIGMLTSSVLAPDGTVYAIGVVKPSLAVRGQSVQIGEGDAPPVVATIADLPGVQPPKL